MYKMHNIIIENKALFCDFDFSSTFFFQEDKMFLFGGIVLIVSIKPTTSEDAKDYLK